MDDNTDKQLRIVSDDGLINITNEELHQQQFELTESLCSESEIRFGSCEASSVKFTVSNTFIPMKDKWITVSMVIQGNSDDPFQIGRYKVFSDVPTADRTKREVTAYDAMYDILNADVADWYNSVLPDKNSKVTMKQFRESFVQYFGLEDVALEDGLVNDDMVVEKTIAITASEEKDTEYGRVSVVGETLSGMDVISSICEINGCFGHIGRDGKFHYIYLPQDIQGLYPADFLYPDHVPEQWDYLSQAETNSLYPQNPKGEKISKSFYISASYEDYVVRSVNKLQIRKEENDVGAIAGKEDGNNCYIIQDNFLVYGKGSEELQTIAENAFSKIKGVVYRPFNADCKGNPCFEVGDAIRIPTKYELIETYILKRTLKGIQALRDSYEATGEEHRSENINSFSDSITQLKGKTNILVRNVEETRVHIDDVEKELSGEIQVLAGKVVLKVTSGEEIALVELGADKDSGTIFKVKAKNLQLSAEETINLMAGGNIDLSGKNITINSDNFSVDKYGNIECRNITAFSISGEATKQFDNTVKASEAYQLAMQALSKANTAINSLNENMDNIRDTVIPELNSEIWSTKFLYTGLDARISNLESRVAQLESKS